MTTLLETIKKHDAKMEALTRTNERLTQTLMLLVDNLIDNNLTLCVDQDYMSDAYRLLKNRGMMDSHRSNLFEVSRDGDCDQSAKLKQAVEALNSSYTL